MVRFAILLPVLLLAAGCAASNVEPVSEANVSSDTWLVMTKDGVGPVTSGTPFTETEMAKVAPGAEIRPIETARENSTAWTKAAFIGEVQAVQFFSGANGTVGEMHGVAQHLAGPNGERIGMTMAQARVDRSECRVGKNLWVGMAVCRARRADNIDLVFAIPQYDGPFDRLPDGETLNNAELQRIVWHAKG